MNILVISQHYYPENFRITDICETLVKMGNTVTVVCGYPNYPEGVIYNEYRGKHKKNKKTEVINGVNVIRCFEIPRGKRKLKLFLNYYSVCLSMKRKAAKLKQKFDYVFVNQTSPVMVGWAGIAYSKKNKVPCILYCYDLWPASLSAGGVKENSLVYKYYDKVSKKIYSNVSKICVTSKSFIEYLHKNHNIELKNIYYLPQYTEDIFEKIETIDHDTLNFVFAGNIGKIQSVETIVKAAYNLKENSEIKFHIVGDGSEFTNVKKLAKEMKLDNITFYGKKPLEDMPYYYGIADAMLVSMSKDKLISKTLPGKVQSYMAARKPIIGAIDGETQLVISDAQCGYVVESENPEKLSEAIMTFFKDNKKLEYGVNAKKYYELYFSKKSFFEKLKKIFEEVKK